MRDDRSKTRLRIVASPAPSERPDDGQPTPAPCGQLLPLRHGAAFLSSRFQIERDRLCAEARAAVNSMIELFFERGIGTHSPSSALVQRETRQFICPIGIIYYFRSRRLGVPVMQCFLLYTPGGDGGSRVGLPAQPYSTASVIQSEDSCLFDRRIAARLDDLLCQPFGDRIAAHVLWIGGGTLDTFTARGRRRARAQLRGERLLGEIADTCRTLSLRPDLAILPTWSLLGKEVRVTEELENAFARAIFAGEAVSHLGRSLSLFSDEARGLDHWRRHRRSPGATPLDPRILFDETRRVLRAIERRTATCDLKRSRYYVSLPLAGEDLLGDVRYLSILRGEMIFHFSTFLAEVSEMKCKDVAFRFAKFAYFTEISKDYFGVRGIHYPLTGLEEEIGNVKDMERWVSGELLRNLEEFGCMSVSIVDGLIQSADDTDTYKSSCERLCELASQILLEDRAIGVMSTNKGYDLE